MRIIIHGMDPLETETVRQVLRDALGEFRTARTDLKGEVDAYVAERYVDQAHEFQARKVREVAHRVATASALLQADLEIASPDANHETRVWSELMKLPTGILQSMFDTIPEGEVRLPRGISSKIASRDDLAKALAPWLARRDFLR